MNLLLLEEADFIAADRVVLRDRRLTHMQEVHRSEVGDSLRVGRIEMIGDQVQRAGAGTNAQQDVQRRAPRGRMVAIAPRIEHRCRHVVKSA